MRGFSNTPPTHTTTTHTRPQTSKNAHCFLLFAHTLSALPLRTMLFQNTHAHCGRHARAQRVCSRNRDTHTHTRTKNARPAHTLSASQRNCVSNYAGQRPPPPNPSPTRALYPHMHTHDTCWQSSSSSEREQLFFLCRPLPRFLRSGSAAATLCFFFTFSACFLFCLEKQHSPGSIPPQKKRTPHALLLTKKRISWCPKSKSSFCFGE